VVGLDPHRNADGLRGRVVALDTPYRLISARGGGMRAVFSCDAGRDVGFLAEIAGVHEMTRSGRRVSVAGDGRHVALVAAALVAHGITPDDLLVEHASLEDVVLKLTGRRLEDS